MADDTNVSSTQKIVRITQEELEQSTNLGSPEHVHLNNKSRKHSNSRAEARKESSDSPSSSDGQLKSNENGKWSGESKGFQVQNEDKNDMFNVKEASNSGSVEKCDEKQVLGTKNVDTAKMRKPRVREGYGLYQVKKGKFSDKMKISEVMTSPKEKVKPGENQLKDGPKKKSPTKGNVSSIRNENAAESEQKSGKSERSSLDGDNEAISGYNREESAKSRSLSANIQVNKKDFHEGNTVTNTLHSKEKKFVKEDWDLSHSSHQVASKAEEEKEDSKRPISADQPNIPVMETKMPNKDEKTSGEANSRNDSLKRRLTDCEKKGEDVIDIQEGKNAKDACAHSKESKNNTSLGQQKIASKEQKPHTVKGIGRGKVLLKQTSGKGKERLKDRKKLPFRRKKSVEKQTEDSKFNEAENESNVDPKNPKDGVFANDSGNRTKENTLKEVKGKATFSDTDKEICDQESLEASSDNTNKKAGIIILPSPGLLEQAETQRDVQKAEKDNEQIETSKGFQKLQRPAGFDPKKPRGKAKIINEKQTEIISEKENLTISSSDEKVWSRIKSECNKMKGKLAKSFLELEDIEEILELSTLLQDLYKELIVKHQDFSFENDVESSLWKNTFHNVITKIRELLDEKPNGRDFNEIVQFYWNFLQDGDDFLQEMLLSLQEEWKFDLDAFVKNPLKMVGCKKQVKYAIRSCHLILLNLGDLERYITDLQQDLNYSKANENYLKAQLLAPKNGKSYNQLAVVAVKSKKKLDAVYYYIRSLETSKPIESARERLLGIFHEIKKKADFTKKQCLEKSVMAEDFEWQRMEENKAFDNDFSKHDTWVFIRGGQCYKLKLGFNGKIKEIKEGGDMSEENGTQEKVSLREASKQFLVYYLYLHGILYTTIGFEHVMTVYEDAMQSFKLVLNANKASCIKKENLIKYMAINIFSINNLLKKLEDKSEVIDVAIIFALDMVGIIAQHCVTLMEDYDTDALDQLLPAVNAWMKWMCGYLDTIKCSSVCHMKDIWENIVRFINAIRSYDILPAKASEDGEPVGLFEDKFLSGFQPLFEMDKPSMKALQIDRNKAERLLRMESLKELAFMISESGKLPVVYNEETRSFEVVTPSVVFDSPTKNGTTLCLEENDTDLQGDESDIIIEDVVENIDDRELQYLKELKAKKMELTAKLSDQVKKKQERAAIVENNASQVHVIFENHPKHIVPDTNCFIDNLAGILKIVDSRDFDVVLPLVVVNELDGLKKGRDVPSKCPNEANAMLVKERARIAMEMLENRFSEDNARLKALTSAGTELDSIAFRNEEFLQDKGKNDDIILSSCLHYCDESMSRFSPGDSPVRLQRNVVLLTDDRNLRLKAHSRQVPTLSLNIFLRMAHLD
ncbi:telomerase-binding protein EST1A-like isoform X1 [Rhopilema esculentum]|uniref:telomerase-binding protein EST1A-like isoform X1 n=1 Tax=Rhopilema esculentum TaxID=499914 RepID=UPI0031CF4895